jgi:V8-like Glu-specific endopeptidase
LTLLVLAGCGRGPDAIKTETEAHSVINGSASGRLHVGTFVDPYQRAGCSGTMVSYNVVLTTYHCHSYFWNQSYRTYFVPVADATANPFDCRNNASCFEVLEMNVSPLVTRTYNGEDDMITALRVRRNAPLGTLNMTYPYDQPVADGTTMNADDYAAVTGYGCNSWNFQGNWGTGYNVRRYGYLQFQRTAMDTSPYLLFKNYSGYITCPGDSGSPVRLAPAPSFNSDNLVGVHYAGNKVNEADSHPVSNAYEFIMGRINAWTRGVTPVATSLSIPGASLGQIDHINVTSSDGSVNCTFATWGGATPFDGTCTGDVPAATHTVRLTAAVFSQNFTEYTQNQVTTSWRCVRAMTALERARNIWTPDTSNTLAGPNTPAEGRTVQCVFSVSVN